MTHIRRLILALVLSCGIVPVFAQAPAPVPALPDTERRTSYSISATTCACNVNFALYGDSTDYQNWIEVWLNGVRVNYNDATFGWTITSPTGPLASISRPVTDAVLTFNGAQTGTVQIVGARRPRRVSQFSESRGVAARDLNQAITDIVAQNRENWDKTNDVTGRAVVAPPGETMSVLPPLASRANKGACFDVNGYLQPCTTISPSSTFIAGNGVQFSGSNPTTITNNIQGGQSIGITGTNPLTISLLSNALNFLLNTTCVATPATCASLLGYANPIWWGADPTNVSCSQTQINSAITASKLVQFSPGGTYNICGAIAMKPNVRLTCAGSTLTQGNGVGLTAFVDFFTNTANNSEFDHCKIDGNYANNSTNLNTNFLSIAGAGASQVNIHDNVFTGSSGGVIVIANSTYVTVRNNYMANSNAYGVAMFNSAAGSRGYHQVLNNTIIGPMLHMIQLDQVDGNIVSGNRLIQGLVLGGATPMQVTVAGTAMTSVSGVNFAGVTLGDVVVANGGTEYPITAVNSNVSLTVAANGNFVNGPAAIGGGDVLSITSTSFNIFTNNFVSGGATGGIVLANFGGNITSTESALANIISNNYVENSGQFGIALESLVNGGAIIGETVITGNIVLGAGRDATAGIAGIGIQLSAAAGTMTGVVIDGNFLYDPFAVTGGFWMSGSGAANATNVSFGNNIQQGFVNGGNMSGYPTVASTPVVKGISAYVIDATACTTWAAVVTGGGSAFCQITYNGTNFTVVGK